jgi:polar amino acid transport system substrate-binding protein
MNDRQHKFILRHLRLTALLLLALLLAACTAAPVTPPATATDAPAGEAPVEEAATVATPAPTPEPIPVFFVGINPEFRPFVFIDDDGNLSGFDIDLLNAMSSVAGFEFGYVTTTFGGLLQGINSNSFDAAISAISVTDERTRMVDFTEPYFGTGQAVVSYLSAGNGIAVPTDNTTILGPDDLTADVRVGVKANTTGERFVVDQTDAEFVRYEEAYDALDALGAGEIDAVVVDTPVISRYIFRDPNAGIKLTGGPVTEEEYAIAVSKDEPELLALLNDALTQVVNDGTYDQIFTKWFGAP